MIQIIALIVSFLQKYVAAWANNRSLAKLQPVTDQPYKAPVNPEVETLRNRKIEIESSIEQLNTPATFAKYSKMQRQLIKIDKQIQELTSKLEEECKVSKAQWEAEREKAKKMREEERSAYVKRSLIIRIIVNIVLINLVKDYFTYSLPFANEWPLNMFSNDEGQISCRVIMVAGNIIFQF